MVEPERDQYPEPRRALRAPGALVASHPLWLVGFRPFFALACIAGATLPLAWAAMFTGAVAQPATLPVPMLQWHAHEMLYGFGWAVLGGFLLTASKNWVGIRGYHGGTLVFLAGAWLLERAGMWFGGAWPPGVFWLSILLFPVAMIGLLLATLLRHRAADSYRDNVYFVLALPLFVPAQWLLLAPEHFAAGVAASVALFRLAFLLMLERTLTQFMKNALGLSLWRSPPVDHAIKSLALLLVAAPLLPQAAGAAACSLLAALLLLRWCRWHPAAALRRLDIGIMYLGYLGIVLQLLLAAPGPLAGIAWVGSVAVHLFGLGVMGLIIPAMIVRIAKGHTGRRVVFEPADRVVLWLMMGAATVRIVLPQLAPAAYTAWLWLAALAWALAFALLGYRYIPWLLAPRVDGKEH
jgi:uncharacterized protein involved in response to NO